MKLKNFFATLVLLCMVFGLKAQTGSTEGVSISGTNTPPHVGAMLDVKSVNKGMLVPRMTLAQRNSIITSPDNEAKGLFIYQTDNNPGFRYFDGTGWKSFGGLWQRSDMNAANIFYSAGKVGIGTHDPNYDLQLDLTTGLLQPDPNYVPDYIFHFGGANGQLNFQSAFPGVNDAFSYLIHKSHQNGPNGHTSLTPTYVQCNKDDRKGLTLQTYFTTNNSHYCVINSNDGDLFFLRESSELAHVYFANNEHNWYFHGKVLSYGMELQSDSTLKKNITPLTNTVANLRQINGVSFNWKDPNRSQELNFGVIAQNVEQIFPNMVRTVTTPGNAALGIEEKTFKTVDYNGFIGLLIEGMKEQQTKIEELEQRLLQLESQ